MRYKYSPYVAQCPVCSYTDNKLLYDITSHQAATQFFSNREPKNREQAIEVIDIKLKKLWCKDTAAIILCSNCSFVFADPFIAGDIEFYNLLPHSTGIGPGNWKWEFDKTLKKITDLIVVKPDLKILEIGASTGTFIGRVAQLIPPANILALEYSEIGLRELKKINIEAQPWHFTELVDKDNYTGKFDIICLFQVLEHLDNLDENFKAFNAISTPNAQLFIGVPNSKKIKFNELKDALLDLPPNHIGRFNKKTFQLLGDKYGWDIAEIRIEPYTGLDVMKTVMYSQSLRRAHQPPVKGNVWNTVKLHLSIKYMRLQAFFMHNQLGETLWVHYKKQAK